MTQYNGRNERMKHEYALHLEGALQRHETTVDRILAAIDAFERFTGRRDFARFRKTDAMAFKAHLKEGVSEQTGKPLSPPTIHALLRACREFFQWLCGQKGYRRALDPNHAAYFRLSSKETRIATARIERPVPSLEDIQAAIAHMPAGSPIERRNRALIAFAILSGSRDGALVTLKLKHVDLDRRSIHFDAREVQTKASKTFMATFFPVGADLEKIVADWIAYLTTELGWGPDAPLFPKARSTLNQDRHTSSSQLIEEHWSSAEPVRRIFRDAFTNAGLAYFNPHSLRKTLARLGERLCRTPEEMKAWSQNMGHEDVLTTLTSYGEVPDRRREEIMRGVGDQSSGDSDLLPDVVARLKSLVREYDGAA